MVTSVLVLEIAAGSRTVAEVDIRILAVAGLEELQLGCSNKVARGDPSGLERWDGRSWWFAGSRFLVQDGVGRRKRCF